MERRDAAVTAALSGAVLVILGYASGIGLRPATEVNASLEQPAAPAVSTAPLLVPSPAQPVEVVPPAPLSGPMPAATAPMPAHTPSPSASPDVPTPSAQPSAPPPSAEPTACPSGLVGTLVADLPLVDGVVSLVTGLLDGVVGGVLPSDGANQTLPCTVGALVSTSCCSAATATRTEPAP
jgi:hypothetical protein